MDSRDELAMARELREEEGEFTSEMGAMAAPPPGVEAADDPEGYIGPDGLAAPHEQPAQVRERYDDVLDHLPTVSLEDVGELGDTRRLAGPEADAATG